MSSQSLLGQLTAKFGTDITGSNLDNVDPWIEVASERIVDVCRYLYETPGLEFNYLNCISGVDYLQTDPKKASKAGWEPHLEVVYHLWSVPNRHSLVLKVMLNHTYIKTKSVYRTIERVWGACKQNKNII